MIYKKTTRIAVFFIVAGMFAAFLGRGSYWLNANAEEIPLQVTKSVTIAPSQPVDQLSGPRYPYRSVQFTQFVDESYSACGVAESGSFYKWMHSAYDKTSYKYSTRPKLGLEELLASKKLDFNRMKDVSIKTESQIAFAAWVHRLVKTLIPRFSLDRGFEFCNVVAYGERQCYLQSILITGLLQNVGFDAGVEMVYKSITGQESNNGHAVTLLKLANGQDIIVDASEPEPFAKQQGLFVRTASDYKYVEPIYEKDSARIAYYRSAGNSSKISTGEVRTMDVAFIRSQFWYYRGERVPGGLLASDKTKEGLRAAEKALRTSVNLNSKNPLAVYMLGRVYFAQGDMTKAKPLIENAYKLYGKFGWIPGGPKQYLDLVRNVQK